MKSSEHLDDYERVSDEQPGEVVEEIQDSRNERTNVTRFQAETDDYPCSLALHIYRLIVSRVSPCCLSCVER